MKRTPFFAASLKGKKQNTTKGMKIKGADVSTFMKNKVGLLPKAAPRRCHECILVRPIVGAHARSRSIVHARTYALVYAAYVYVVGTIVERRSNDPCMESGRRLFVLL